ncbi:hypothetical protein ACROYT_G015057 [Oculina patagonica]
MKMLLKLSSPSQAFNWFLYFGHSGNHYVALKPKQKMKLQEGEYTIGELVVPKKYKKLVINSDGTLKEVEFTVSGRKIPLTDIRKRELDRLEKLGIVRGHTNEEYGQMSDDQITEQLKELGEVGNHSGDTPGQRREHLIKFERTRHLMIWGDGSTILNHGHLLYLVQSVYNPAFYYSSAEMKARGYDDMDVPTLVEKPHLYILGRCSAKEVEQLAYVDTRRECLDQLTNNLQRTAPLQNTSCRTSWKKDRNGGIKPFKDMTVPELKIESVTKGLDVDERLKRKELQQNLKDHLKGVQRVPALLINEQDKSLKDINLEMYEVLPTEPLHDVKEHTANVISEITHHLTNDEKVAFRQTLELVNGTKDQLRGSDYREMTIETKVTEFNLMESPTRDTLNEENSQTVWEADMHVEADIEGKSENAEKFARRLAEGLDCNGNFSPRMERQRMAGALLGSCFSDIGRRNKDVCKICHDDDGEDWAGCDGCAQYFHASCLGATGSKINEDTIKELRGECQDLELRLGSSQYQLDECLYPWCQVMLPRHVPPRRISGILATPIPSARHIIEDGENILEVLHQDSVQDAIYIQEFINKTTGKLEMQIASLNESKENWKRLYIDVQLLTQAHCIDVKLDTKAHNITFYRSADTRKKRTSHSEINSLQSSSAPVDDTQEVLVSLTEKLKLVVPASVKECQKKREVL